MTRAALAGVLMGLFLGGAILIVLALQMAVVEMPGQASAPAEAASEPVMPAETVAPPPADGRVATVEPGPAARQLDDLDLLLDKPGEPGAVTGLDGQGNAASFEPAAQPFLSDGPGSTDGREIAAVLDFLTPLPDPTPVTVALRVSSAERQALRPIGVFLALPGQTPDSETVSVSTGQGDLVSAALPVWQRVAPQVPSARAERWAVEPRVPAPAGARSVPMSETSNTPAKGEHTHLSREMANERVQGSFPADRLLRLRPDVLAGAERPPMVLWLMEDETGAATVGGSGDETQNLATLPALNRPDALSAFASEVEAAAPPTALFLSDMAGAPSELIAPVLNLPALQGLPIVLSAGAPATFQATLHAQRLRNLPAYLRLEAGMGEAELNEAFGRIALRAMRDGFVAVQVAPDPWLRQEIEAWRNGAGSGFGIAGLTDVFGG